MRCYFLVYEKDGRKGNDLTNNDPFKWLIEHRGKNSESSLIVLRWLQVEVDQYAYDGLQAQIGIEHDEEKLKKPEKEIVEETKKLKRPRGWVFMAEYVDADGNVFHKGKEKPGLRGTKSQTKPKG